MNILVVEDNAPLANMISDSLVESGYSATVALTSSAAEELAAEDAFDLYILDVMLPDRSGLDLCKIIRRMGIAAPVLMLTSLSTVTNKIDGLDSGADDYLTKPFEFGELLARIRALLRRGTASTAESLTFRDLELSLSQQTVERQGVAVKLSGKQFALLEYFMRNAEQILSRTVITQSVWDAEHEQGSNLVDVQVAALRKKLATTEGVELIHTVVGRGYRFGLPVR